MRVSRAPQPGDLVKGGTTCLLCCRRAEHYPHRVDDAEAIPRWQCPHRSGLLTWLFMLTMPNALFLSLVAPFLVGEAPVAVTVAAVLSYLLCTMLMGLTSFSDPGTVPPATSATRRAPMGHSEVVINGVSITLKYCVACGIQRPPRASHCRETNRCVEKWDHYCPWVGNSIGRRNYHWFLGFIFCTLAHGLYIGGLSFYVLKSLVAEERRAREAKLGEAVLAALARAPFGCVLLVYCVLITLLLGLLFGYHLYLVTLNQTTNENVRGVWEDTRNPYDGGPWKNWAEVCCGCGQTPSGQGARHAGTDEEAMLPAAPAGGIGVLPGVSTTRLEASEGAGGDASTGTAGGGAVSGGRQAGQEMLPMQSAAEDGTEASGHAPRGLSDGVDDDEQPQGPDRQPSLERLAVDAAAEQPHRSLLPGGGASSAGP